jgi:hypothetical protein
MLFEKIEKVFEKGSLLPVEDVWAEKYRTPIKINMVLKNKTEDVTFFQTGYATYPDLEDEYLLYRRGLKVRVYIFGYLENKFWEVRWHCIGITGKRENSINELLYDICLAIGFPSKIAPNSSFPIKIRELVRLPR